MKEQKDVHDVNDEQYCKAPREDGGLDCWFLEALTKIAVFNFFKPDDDDRDAETHPYDRHQKKLWSLVFDISIQGIVGYNCV